MSSEGEVKCPACGVSPVKLATSTVWITGLTVLEVKNKVPTLVLGALESYNDPSLLNNIEPLELICAACHELIYSHGWGWGKRPLRDAQVQDAGVSEVMKEVKKLPKSSLALLESILKDMEKGG